MSQNQSPLESVREDIEALTEQNLSYREILDYLAEVHNISTSDRSLRRAFRRWGIDHSVAMPGEAPGVKIENDQVELVTSPQPWDSASLTDTDTLLRERGLDPEDWDVASLVVNEWDSPSGYPLKQFKVHLHRKKALNMVTPARMPGDYRRNRPKVQVGQTSFSRARLVVLAGDQQAPFHNSHLHDLFLEWLDFNQPDEGVLIGDTMDFPDISRHPNNPEWAATTQECIDAAYLLLRDYVQMSEGTHWTKLSGNHDERLRRAIIDRIADIYGLRKAQVPGDVEDLPLLDVANILRLDELGIDYIRPNGGYNHAQHKLSKYLAVRHGWIARKGSGASALATLNHLGYSVTVGHTHRLSQVFQTVHDIDGKPTTLTAVETGCMCRIEEGLGYTPAPDWQNGFATATIWPNGFFSIDLAKYVDGSLLYRDQRYS